MILGIDLGGTNVRLGQLVDGKLINKIIEPSPGQMSLDESLSYLKAQIQRVITPETRGIGVGVPSVLDSETGIVYNVANIPSWVEVPLKDILESEFRIPVYINNDSNCFTLGEKKIGEGRSFKHLVGVTLGTGVGAGIIINNHLYGGSNTGAGEIGCLPYLDATLEDYCGSMFFKTHYNTTGKEAAEKAMNKNSEAITIWNEFGRHMGRLVEAIVLSYDPEAIIFGGGITAAFPLFEQAMKEAMTDFPYPKSIEKLQIRISTNPDIAILGAAALVEED
ncbi:ROK family protein [Massilibacteroides sp.]|uniref:ROK family protein n=1 Tax=Massilibacteroides sp. TaxID=2034766 RepID=UPI00262CD826|nr:ROK family protein [Massilibacteroides sp.]MDD4515902.1 ROK family protein [Massilibacteroides sp.]